MSDQINLKDVYDIVEKSRVELGSHILRLENKFDLLEAGRVTTLEANIQLIKGQMDPIKKIVYGLTGTVLLAVLGAILKLIL